MKKILFALIFLPFLSLAQGQPQPFKHANTIILQTPDSGSVIMRNLISAFSKNGFSVAFADKEAGVVNSNAKKVQSDEITLNSIITEDNKVILTGTFKTNYTTSTMPVVFRGMKDSSFMNTWLIMQKVASSYPNAALTYEKR